MEKPERVMDFLNILSVDLKDRAARDFGIMQQMKAEEQIMTVSKKQYY